MAACHTCQPMPGRGSIQVAPNFPKVAASPSAWCTTTQPLVQPQPSKHQVAIKNLARPMRCSINTFHSYISTSLSTSDRGAIPFKVWPYIRTPSYANTFATGTKLWLDIGRGQQHPNFVHSTEIYVRTWTQQFKRSTAGLTRRRNRSSCGCNRCRPLGKAASMRFDNRFVCKLTTM